MRLEDHLDIKKDCLKGKIMTETDAYYDDSAELNNELDLDFLDEED